MNVPPVRLVVFDLGGVLVRICRSWEEACAAAGIEFRGVPDDEASRARRHETLLAFDVGGMDPPAYFRALSASLGGLYAPDEVARVHHAWIRGEYAGVPALFDALQAAGLPAGLLSNTNEAHWRRMVPGAGLASPEFPSLHRALHPHASHVLRAAKPDATAFARFEARTGRAGAEILFFDDLERNVLGARAAGWRAETVDPEDDPPRRVLERLRAEGLLRA